MAFEPHRPLEPDPKKSQPPVPGSGAQPQFTASQFTGSQFSGSLSAAVTPAVELAATGLVNLRTGLFLLQDPDPLLRRRYAQTFERHTESVQSIIPKVAAALIGEADPDVSGALLRGLIRAGSAANAAVPALFHLLQTKEGAERLRIAEALGKIGGKDPNLLLPICLLYYDQKFSPPINEFCKAAGHPPQVLQSLFRVHYRIIEPRENVTIRIVNTEDLRNLRYGEFKNEQVLELLMSAYLDPLSKMRRVSQHVLPQVAFRFTPDQAKCAANFIGFALGSEAMQSAYSQSKLLETLRVLNVDTSGLAVALWHLPEHSNPVIHIDRYLTGVLLAKEDIPADCCEQIEAMLATDHVELGRIAMKGVAQILSRGVFPQEEKLVDMLLRRAMHADPSEGELRTSILSVLAVPTSTRPHIIKSLQKCMLTEGTDMRIAACETLALIGRREPRLKDQIRTFLEFFRHDEDDTCARRVWECCVSLE